jgi:hypothetical protein
MAYIRKCKYECGTQLLGFDEVERKYKEHPSGILHTKERCAEAKRKLQNQNQPQQPQQPQQQQNNQDQRSLDIKAAQVQRKKEHDQLIKNMQWLTKMLAIKAEQDGGGPAKDILESMGFEEFQEEQRQQGYEDL